jgi:Flp pilus assembly protein TadG
MISLSAYIRGQRGASAVEFALVIPVAVMLILGVIHMSMVVYSAVNLHFAVEGTARCIAVSANVVAAQSSLTPPCKSTTATSVQSYGVARYVGPNISPTFVLGSSANAACSTTNLVCATGTYKMSMGFVSIPITVSASAYYAHS